MKTSKGIEYQFDGSKDKPVLLFSNSLGTDYSMWDKQVEECQSKFHILRYNTDALGVNSIEDLGKQVISLLDELKLNQVHYCGISLGGLIGMWLARYHQDRFHSLTLANTAPQIAKPQIWEERIQFVKHGGLGPIALASPSRWFTETFTRSHPEVVRKALHGFKTTSPESYINCCEVLKKTNLWDLLPQIQGRILIIAGEFDQVTTVEDAKKMAEKVKDSQVIILPAAHLSNIEASEFSKVLTQNCLF